MAKLYFRFGVMGSSKSAQALTTKFNYEEQGMRVWLIKPAADTRYGMDKVYSRIGLEEKADALEQEKSKKKDIEELIGKYCCFDKLTYEMVTDFIDYIEVGEKDPDTEKQEIRIHWNL